MRLPRGWSTRQAFGALVVGLLSSTPRVAWAHPGQALAPHDLATAWSFSPTVLLGLAVSALLYGRGVRALWRRAGRGRGVPRWRTACFSAGLASLALALISPVDALGAVLFSGHMTQHLLLLMVAAPLLAVSDAAMVMLWAFPRHVRRHIGRTWRELSTLRRLWAALRAAPVAWTMHVAVLWLWHLPRFYESALRNEGVHVLEHLSFLITALLFWWVVLAPHRRRPGVGVKIMMLFAAALQSTLLGAAITFARHPWYPSHFGTTRAWGLTPLEDQQLAGLLMWIPGGVTYLAVLLPLAVRMLRGGAAELSALRDGEVSPTHGLVPPLAGVSARGTP